MSDRKTPGLHTPRPRRAPPKDRDPVHEAPGKDGTPIDAPGPEEARPVPEDKRHPRPDLDRPRG